MFDFSKLSRDYKKDPLKKGEPICKQDLMYLHNELNLLNKETAEILGCPKHKVDHFCFKYGLKKTREQRLTISYQCNKDKWNNFSEEKKQAIRAKQKAWWDNRSKEQKEEWKRIVSKNSKAMWKNMSEEQIQEMLNKMSITAKRNNENMTEEEKLHRIQAFKNTWYGASEKEKQLRNKHNSESKKEWWNNVSEEVIQQRSKQYKKTMSSKTEEELKEIQNKIYETKRKNNTLNVSKPERYYENLLKQKYKDNVLCQYKSNEFPFACDFYLKHIDLYIDLNFHWTHGKHLFDVNNEEDKQTLELWKQRSIKSKFYKNAIYTWTDLDIRKDKISKQNNINRVVFYTEKEFNKWFEEDK